MYCTEEAYLTFQFNTMAPFAALNMTLCFEEHLSSLRNAVAFLHVEYLRIIQLSSINLYFMNVISTCTALHFGTAQTGSPTRKSLASQCVSFR